MVKALQEAAKSLRLHNSPKQTNGKSFQRAISIFGRPGRTHRMDESDEEDDSDEEKHAPMAVRAKPVMSLRPMSRIVGFKQ
jgi:rapamycin-insensitive companion of mTOR